MMLTFRPIQNWPDGWRDHDRERPHSPFQASYDDTLVLLRMAKALYRDASKTYHPDRGGDPGIFANIARAYAVLGGET